eukprot:s1829_g6.t1
MKPEPSDTAAEDDALHLQFLSAVSWLLEPLWRCCCPPSVSTSSETVEHLLPVNEAEEPAEGPHEMEAEQPAEGPHEMEVSNPLLEEISLD